MATTFKNVAWASLGNVLTTELNTLTSAGYSAYGTAYDNTSGLYLAFAADINLASLNPTGTPYLQLFMGMAIDGTNYEDVPSSTNLGSHMAIPPVSLTTGSATKHVTVPAFFAPPSKVKFALLNGAGVNFAASGNTVALYGLYQQGV